MGIVLRADLGAILVAVQNQLAAGLVLWLPSDRVLSVVRPEQEIPKLVGDQDVLIRFRGFRGDPGHRDRHDCRLLHRLEITVRTRFGEIDAEYSDLRALTDSAKGSYLWWQRIMDPLQGFTPQDASGNALTCEPLMVLDGDDGKSERQEPGWLATTLTFSVLTEVTLTQRQPNSTGWITNVL